MKSEEAQLKEKPKDSNNIHYSKTSIDNLPFDVSKDLDQFKRILVSKEFDYFKIVHICQDYMHDYKIFWELPDGDKKLLFTCNQHYECNFLVVVMIAPAFYVVAHIFFVTQFHFKWIIEEMETHFILKE